MTAVSRILGSFAIAVIIAGPLGGIASADGGSAPGQAPTFYRGVTTTVSTWSAVTGSWTESRQRTETQSCSVTNPGGQTKPGTQTVTIDEQRTATETTTYQRTVQHRGTANSSGKLLSDETATLSVIVTYSTWAETGRTAGGCVKIDDGDGECNDSDADKNCGKGNDGETPGNGNGNGSGGNGNGNR